MSEDHGTAPSPSTEQRRYAELPDAELTELIRAGAPTALPATQELRRRHLPAVLSYARLCARTQTAANQLTEQSFDLAAQETCRGIDPRGPWRHHLLLLVQRVGATWAAGNRRERLDPECAEWLDGSGITADNEPGPPGPQPEEGSAMLGGFFTLPAHTRGILWYGVVDDEPDGTVATYLGIPPHTTAALRDSAQGALRQACVRTHLERSGDRKCQGFRGIIEAAVRPGDARHSEDLDQHLATCPSCAHVVGELVRMGEDPRTVIAEGLLGWAGAAYVTAAPVRGPSAAKAVAPSDAAPGQPKPSAVPPSAPGRASANAAHAPAGRSADPRSAGAGPWRAWPMSQPATVAGAAVAAVAVAVAVVAVLAADSGDTAPTGHSARTPGPKASTVTATATATVSAPPVTVTATPSKKPHRSPSPSPTPTPPRTGQGAGAPLPGDSSRQVVNNRSGLCLDIADERLKKGTDVITARCSGADSQQWRLDSRGLLHTSADPAFCLDSRGDTDRGVGIWTCSSVDGDNGENLQFLIDRDGAIRPYIAPDFAVTPRGDDPCGRLELLPTGDRADQHWRAGA